jgi:hypothetical protein
MSISAFIIYEVLDKTNKEIDITSADIFVFRFILDLLIKLGSLIIFSYLFKPSLEKTSPNNREPSNDSELELLLRTSLDYETKKSFDNLFEPLRSDLI